MKTRLPARFSAVDTNILVTIAEHRKVDLDDLARLITVLPPRGRVVAEYIIASERERAKMVLPPDLEAAAIAFLDASPINGSSSPPG